MSVTSDSGRAAAAGSPSPVRIHDLPATERPREKLARLGAGALSDAELLALFFRSGSRGASAIDLGRRLLERFGSLRELSRSSVSELMATPGIGSAKASELAAAFELGSRLAREQWSESRIDSPEAVCALVGAEMRSLRQESLRILLLNTRFGLIRVEEIFRGSINESIAHPREILRAAIIHSAHAFIVVHNHPSGDPSPSEADRSFTRRLASVAGEVQIQMLDHIIIGLPVNGGPPYFSFREAGLV